jgi:hypothetical protein
MRKKLVIIVIVLGMMAMACSALSFNLPSAGDIVGTALATNGLGDLVEMATMLATSGLSDDAQSMIETMVAGGTTVPMETLMAGFNGFSGDGTFQDDFSNTSGNWPQGSSEGGSSGYQDGGFNINVTQENYSIWAESQSGSYTDVSVEVDATVLGGPQENEYGLLCRYADVNNFYVATIASDGYFFFWERIDGGELTLISESGQQSQNVNMGNASNHIRLDCVGDTLTLYVNGEFVGELHDDSLAAGDVGMYAGTFTEGGTDVLFDNFVVSQP